jgi:hypothetical protein
MSAQRHIWRRWGRIIKDAGGEVPYLLDDRTFSFTASYDLIGTPDAWWSLKAETFELGALRGRVGVVAPEPSSLLLLLLGLPMLLVVSRKQPG